MLVGLLVANEVVWSRTWSSYLLIGVYFLAVFCYFTSSDPVHCFTAIFAPTALHTDVYHHWQYYSATREAWVDTDRIGYELVGGRRNRYRGVTYKRHVHPGRAIAC